jgi:hypothetical protein
MRDNKRERTEERETEERWGQKETRRQWKRSNRIYYLADSMSSESYDYDTQYNTLADSKIRLERERESVCVCVSTDERNNRLAIFGSNKLEEKVVQSTNFSFLCHFNFCFFSRGIFGHIEEASRR